MTVLTSHVKPRGAEFEARKKHHEGLAAELKRALSEVKRGGSEQAVELHRKRGKLLPRERIERLLDPGTPFLELSP
ncbi:MAG TPA: methylcrotonoyl-CoA carboxylase, partial [Candidatus Eisenbacteria bacterium]|nr:methylcrotonoyl-CoA carboxylase [Candidatus Eisenbacteria bacterium]